MNISEILEKLPLFSGVKYTAELEERFPSETVVLSLGESYEIKNSLAVFVSGKADIVKEGQGKSAYMKSLSGISLLGLATLFSDSDGYISTLIAKTSVTLVIFSEEFVKYLIENDSAFALRLVKLLCQKVRYLNCRIDFYTCSSAESKIYEYLVRAGGEVNISMSKLSQTLGIARASLYRAISSLEDDGIIVKNGKNIKLNEVKS